MYIVEDSTRRSIRMPIMRIVETRQTTTTMTWYHGIVLRGPWLPSLLRSGGSVAFLEVLFILEVEVETVVVVIQSCLHLHLLLQQN
jgi:hypothetical protein